MSFSSIQILLEFGAVLNGLEESIVITLPTIAVTFLVSTVPLGKITLNLGLFWADKSVESESSTVI